MDEKKKRCTKLKDATVYVMADFRNDYRQGMIMRLYSYCVSKGYDIRWVGYTESDSDFTFRAGDKKILFTPDVYEKYDGKKDIEHLSDITYVFVGLPVNEDEEPEVVCLATSISELRAKRLLRIANDFQRSTETDMEKRFETVNKSSCLEIAGITILDYQWLLQLPDLGMLFPI